MFWKMYVAGCCFWAGYYCAKNDVLPELRADAVRLYDSLVDYTTARAAVQRHRAEVELYSQPLEQAGA